mmetsp:Transcript_64409/g.73947  ORF Transcript_64409/g.73947 Transcript_64409/m.73947 type:complete len:260 (+) Transcript_64409:707-1486(+)
MEFDHLKPADSFSRTPTMRTQRTNSSPCRRRCMYQRTTLKRKSSTYFMMDTDERQPHEGEVANKCAFDCLAPGRTFELGFSDIEDGHYSDDSEQPHRDSFETSQEKVLTVRKTASADDLTVGFRYQARSHSRVLFVDDQQFNLDVLTALADKCQLNYDLAHDGPEALQAMLNKLVEGGRIGYDLILLDNHMVTMNGLEVCRHLHEMNIKANILVYSSSCFEEDIQNFKKYGVFQFLDKPARWQQILSVFAEHNLLDPEK